jgi:integrase
MSVRIVAARSGKGFEYDVRLTWPEGGRLRERGKCPTTGKDASKRWAEAREREIFLQGKEKYRPLSASDDLRGKSASASTAPTLASFWPRVVTDHYRANRKKASTTDAAESIAKNHLLPALGSKRLGEITTSDVQALKGKLASKGPKTVNNVLSVLSRALRCAVDWDVLKAVPCKFGLLRVNSPEKEFYEVAVYRRLVDAASFQRTTHLLVLLAGSAGLRRGELIALRWTDIDFERRLLHVRKATWRRVEDDPKGNRPRSVPLTEELLAALKAHRNLRERVLYSNRGEDLSNRAIRNMLALAQRRANLEANGGIHILRHTFCSHLAIAGVPAKAIQELAGHADLSTTLKYMHLSPSNRSEAMSRLSAFYTTQDTESTRAEVTSPGMSG